LEQAWDRIGNTLLWSKVGGEAEDSEIDDQLELSLVFPLLNRDGQWQIDVRKGSAPLGAHAPLGGEAYWQKIARIATKWDSNRNGGPGEYNGK
jgi:hypothetical protein